MIDPRILRDDPDRVRAAQAKRGLSDDVVDRALAADAARRAAIAEFEARRAEQKQRGKQVARAQGEEKQALLAEVKDARRRGQAARGRPGRGRGGVARGADGHPQHRRRRGARRAARTTTSSSSTSAPRASSTSSRATTSSSAGCSARSTSSAAPRCRARGSTSSPASARSSSSRWSTWRWTRPARPASRRSSRPSLVKPRAMEGTGFLGQAADDVYRIEGEEMYLVGTSEVAMAAFHSDEILDVAVAAPALRRAQPVLPQGGRLARQGHPRHHPGPLVRQGRDVRLHDDRGVVRRAPAAAPVGEGVHGQARAVLPRDRHRGRRPRAVRAAQVRHARRGSPPRAATASSPRPRTAPTSRAAGSTPAAGSADGSITPVATLNGTLTAIPRTIVAILETHQQADGSVAGARRRCAPTSAGSRC